MRLRREECLLFFFSFLMICSQIVPAQDKNWGQISIEKSNLPAPELDDPLPTTTVPTTSITPVSSFSPRTGFNEAVRTSWTQEATEFPEIHRKPEIKENDDDFRAVDVDRRSVDFQGSEIDDLKKFPRQRNTPFDDQMNKDESGPLKGDGFNWRGALNQSMMFLAVQHGYALTQPKTRQSLKGKFFKDYANSVKSLSGWDDGGRFFTNYIAHPMQGSLTGFIYVQNSPRARRQQFEMSGDYWRSRMKAMLWTTAWSTQFEIGPLSQASIGNVGSSGKQTWEDIVITPTIGTAMLIGEEAVDRYVIKSIERWTNNFYIKVFSRMLFNPTRVFANLLRFKEPWYRDRPPAR